LTFYEIIITSCIQIFQGSHLEKRPSLRFHCNLLPGFSIPAAIRFIFTSTEASESPDFNPAALLQPVGKTVEDQIDYGCYVITLRVSFFGYCCDEI
jgi:hypothetical protein